MGKKVIFSGSFNFCCCILHHMKPFGLSIFHHPIELFEGGDNILYGAFDINLPLETKYQCEDVQSKQQHLEHFL